MLLPINDDNPLEGITHAYVTWALIAVNIAIFVLVQHGYRPEIDIATAFGYGAIPAVVNHAAVLPAEYARLPAELTLISYMFLHGGWLHLAGNMAFLWVFGDNVEDAFGHARYLVFYLACGVAGGLAHAMAVPDSASPLVGASAAISGLVGAYLMLHPNVRIWVLMFLRIPLRVPAIWPLGAWIGFQLWSALRAGEADTAWWAHVGGLVTGAVLAVFLRRPGVPLWVTTRDGTPDGHPPI
ncbi:rhomboid family intramembrane serine protease [Ancylobacter defluvii]|uniref:Rhomboid family intramembrane serine protease n=1 Tax=Ancylobacter defluvii TaxID=1282440 RepID=A0A9W6JY99_9HYPH|nr:rhomboid family intramembrane serine protease [Ancylobacter defluvii]MBS7587064.1 rhomboid family intramembrane serine protease [Ancylobacter defluvii]GLK85367.1 rhomboid family intramembrane serine protease [Ancylobacter defluvii]